MRQRDLTPPNSNGYRRNVKEKIKLTKIKTRNYERETPIRAKKIKTLRSTRGINAVSLWPSLVFRVRQQLTKPFRQVIWGGGKNHVSFPPTVHVGRSITFLHVLNVCLPTVGGAAETFMTTNKFERIHYVCRVDDINAQLNVCCRYTVPGL